MVRGQARLGRAHPGVRAQVLVRPVPRRKRQVSTPHHRRPAHRAAHHGRATRGEILAHAKLGRDLLAEEEASRQRKAVEGERSIGRVVKAYLAEPKVKRLRSYEQVKHYLETVWAPVHALSAETCSRHELAAILQQIARTRGEVSANRARSALNKMFAVAMTSGITVAKSAKELEVIHLVREQNPVGFLEKSSEKHRSASGRLTSRSLRRSGKRRRRSTPPSAASSSC